MNSTARRPQSQQVLAPALRLLQEQGKTDPDPEICRTLLQEWYDHEPHQPAEPTADPTILIKCQRTFQRLRRKTERGSPPWNQWDELLRLVKLLQNRKTTQPEKGPRPVVGDNEQQSGLPTTVSQYLQRLQKHDKDLYKNPPVLPPPAVTVFPMRAAAVPKRNANSGRLHFVATPDADPATTQLIQVQFRPNTTPQEILRGGAFGGTYFRPIHSAVTNTFYSSSQRVLQDTVDPDWIAGLDPQTHLISTKYNAAVNQYGVKCGGSLGMWESSGWISDADPYGWFQWFCRFYQGRRSTDDARQIKRWLGVAGPKGRFKSQLCNKILAAGGGGLSRVDDNSISPVIRQSLLHWGLRITNEVLEQHRSK